MLFAWSPTGAVLAAAAAKVVPCEAGGGGGGGEDVGSCVHQGHRGEDITPVPAQQIELLRCTQLASLKHVPTHHLHRPVRPFHSPSLPYTRQRAVVIFDRRGRAVDEIALPPPDAAGSATPGGASGACCCAALEWDAAGDALAVLPAGGSAVLVWSPATRELQRLEAEFRVRLPWCVGNRGTV